MQNLPKHIAIIMDGNRRWAKEHKLPVYAGHKRVVQSNVEELIEHAASLKIPYITFWAFSTENWGRSRLEVAGIMKLFGWALKNKAKTLMEKGAKVQMIGDLSKFPKEIQQGFEKLIDKTKNNQKITTVFALNYGGRNEITRAVTRLFHQQLATGDKRLEITAKMLEQFLDTKDIPDPELIIRTGGEQRLSGFMLWQAEYSELYFTKILMPDFGPKQLDEALAEYGRRQQRRGK